VTAKKRAASKGAKKRRRRSGPTTRAELLELHRAVVSKSRRVIVAKNADYGRTADALANFRLGAAAAGITVAQAVVARLADKVHRLGRAAAGERLRIREDDVVDATTLPVFVKAALRERRRR